VRGRRAEEVRSGPSGDEELEYNFYLEKETGRHAEVTEGKIIAGKNNWRSRKKSEEEKRNSTSY